MERRNKNKLIAEYSNDWRRQYIKSFEIATYTNKYGDGEIYTENELCFHSNFNHLVKIVQQIKQERDPKLMALKIEVLNNYNRFDINEIFESCVNFILKKNEIELVSLEVMPLAHLS